MRLLTIFRRKFRNYKFLSHILKASEINRIIKEVEKLGIKEHSLSFDIVSNLIKNISFKKILEEIENKVGHSIINNLIFKHNLATLYNKASIISREELINPNRVLLEK